MPRGRVCDNTSSMLASPLSDLAAWKSLCGSVSLPVVVLIGAGPGGPARAGLAATGAKRIGVGGAMVRAALSAFVSTARDLIEGRELDGLRSAMSGHEITEIFQRRLASS
jgi:2-methylisocitrate lyase-like PEP mutase family enzyme